MLSITLFEWTEGAVIMQHLVSGLMTRIEHFHHDHRVFLTKGPLS
jgi:hypothetical protein